MHSRSPIPSDFYVVRFNDGTECPVHISDPCQSEPEERRETKRLSSGRITAIDRWDTEGYVRVQVDTGGELDAKASSIKIHESAIDKDWGRGSQFLHEQDHRRQWDFI